MFLSSKNIGIYYGQWFKYTYYCNDQKVYIYCHNNDTLKKLIEEWQDKSDRLHNGDFKYSTEYEKVEMTLKEILIDQNCKLKYLFRELTMNEYIQ